MYDQRASLNPATSVELPCGSNTKNCISNSFQNLTRVRTLSQSCRLLALSSRSAIVGTVRMSTIGVLVGWSVRASDTQSILPISESCLRLGISSSEAKPDLTS